MNHIEKIEIVKHPDAFDQLTKNAICILTFRPTSDLLKLYHTFDLYVNYTVYVIVDDNEWNIDNLQKEFPKFHFVKIKEEECKKNGFTNFGFFVKNGEPSAWDKGIMYFSHIQKDKYDFVWFIEDDVFVPHIKNIIQIDHKYFEDFVVRKIIYNDKQDWNLCCKDKVDQIFYKNICKTMVCICRISKRFLQIIDQYIHQYKKGFFIEFFFPILATFYKISIKELPEMNTIKYRTHWSIEQILEHPTYFYHPVKDLQQLKEFWNIFNLYHFYINIYDLPTIISKLKILNFKKTETNFIQQSIYQNTKNKNKKIIIKKINHNNILIFQHKIQKHLFENITQIETFEQGVLFALNMNYEFLSFQTLFEEIYNNPQNEKITLFVYPGFIPFLDITSSSDQFPKNLRSLDITGLVTTNIQDIIQQQNNFFGTHLSLDINLEFQKLNKSIQYISKNKDYFMKMMKEQKNMYDHFIKEKKINKIYKSNSFKTFD